MLVLLVGSGVKLGLDSMVSDGGVAEVSSVQCEREVGDAVGTGRAG